MLERWLCEGILDDPFAEFMVQENPVRDACAFFPSLAGQNQHTIPNTSTAIYK